MKYLIIAVISICILSCTERNNSMYLPAEWEPHSAIWLGWENEVIKFYPAITDFIKIVSPNVNVKIAVSSDSLMLVAKQYLTEQGIDIDKIDFYTIPGDRYWIRDYGPVFLVSDNGKLGIADFIYDKNGKPQWIKDKYNNHQDSIDKYLDYNHLKKVSCVDSLIALYEEALIKKSSLVHEGGAIEVNGKGTLILCESTVFHRNPDWKKIDIENEFKRVLGVKNIIWMKEGLAEDPKGYFRRITGNYIGGGVGGHTDEFVRFVDANTIMIAWVDENERYDNPINEMNYLRMSENLTILENSKDQDGYPFKIIKVPLPDLIEKKVVARQKIDDRTSTYDVTKDDFKESESPEIGDTLIRIPAASYLNFLITNGLVIIPKYTHVGSSIEKEQKVQKLFEKQFPDRKIVFIDVMPQNWWGGGIHCSAMQQPASLNDTI